MQAYLCRQVQHISPPVGIWGRHGLRSVRCRALPTSLECALSRRTDKKLLRDICQDAFQRQEEVHKIQLERRKLQLELLEEKLGRANERLRNLLKDRSAELLFSQGLLTVRGVLEYLEDDCRWCHILKDPNDRQEIWTEILQQSANQDLVKGLTRVNDEEVDRRKLEQEISELCLYATDEAHATLYTKYLSAQTYFDQKSYVHIFEGPLLSKHCRMMMCICEHFGFPYMYRQVKTQHQEPRSARQKANVKKTE